MKKILLLVLNLNIGFIYAALNGVYTISPVSGNYATITQAINALYSQGVSGSVTFNIAPATYTEHVILNGLIPGASAVNNITFQKNPTLAGTVSIAHSPSVADDFVNEDGNAVKVKGVSFVNFVNLSMSVLTPNYTDNQWGGILSIIENSNFIKVDSCTFIGENSNTTTQLSRNGVKVYRSNNVLILNSTFNTVNGISLFQSENCIAHSNIMNVFSSGFFGFQCDNFDFYNNKIKATSTSAFSSNALTIQSHQGLSANARRAVYNNFINSGSTGVVVSGPFINDNAKDNFIYNNTILSNSGYGINLVGANYSEIVNNIIQANSGLIIRASNSTNSDVLILNNNLYPNTATFSCSILGVNHSSLSTMSGLAGFTIAGNIIADPQFIDIASNNLHVNSTLHIDAGTTAINGIFNFDIDNEIRVGNPDIGADELGIVNPECITPNTLKVLLEGAYNTSSLEMNTNLSTIIPSVQPYNNSPWNYSGTETITSATNDMVDWVLVEARSTDRCTVLARKAAILRKDGSILNHDGSCALTFAGLTSGSYYFAVRHRTHLSIISNNLIPYPFTSIYDFSINSSQAFQGIQKTITTKAAMYVGDFNNDGIISVADYNIYASQASAVNQYLNSDANLDKNITVADYNLLNPNLSIIGPSVLRLSGSTSDCGYLSPGQSPLAPIIFNDWILPSSQTNGKIYISVRGGSGVYSYKWQKVLSGGVLSKVFSTNEDVSSLDPATYKVTVTDSKGKSVSKNYIVNSVQKLRINNSESNIMKDFSFSIYPNPLKAGNTLNLEFKETYVGSLNIEIFSIGGHLLFNHSIDNFSNNVISLNTANLELGIYIILIRDANFNLVDNKKFIIQ